MRVLTSSAILIAMFAACSSGGAGGGTDLADATTGDLAGDPATLDHGSDGDAPAVDPGTGEDVATQDGFDPGAPDAVEAVPDAVEDEQVAPEDPGPAEVEVTADAVEDVAAEVVDPCVHACVADGDCGFPGLVCNGGRCGLRSRFCYDDLTAMNERGESSDCTPYTCDAVFGSCLREAAGTGDCAPGYLWDGDISCVAQPPSYLALTAAPALPDWVVACRTGCAKDADCAGISASGGFCWNGACEPRSSYCSFASGATQMDPGFATPDNPAASPCGDYSCDPAAGTCFSDCVRTDDCAPGLSCDLTDRTCKSAM